MRVVCLDSGPLGLLVHPRDPQDFQNWLARLRLGGAAVIVPEIADYEVRRELIRLGQRVGIGRLDFLRTVTDEYEAITTSIMSRAAELWAQTRNRGRPLSDPPALDADVILAATADAIASRGHDVVVATTNLGHLAGITNAALWHALEP